MTPRLGLGIALAALLTAVPPSAVAKPQQSCFRADNVSGFRAVDDKTVYLSVGVRQVYRIDLMGSCPDVDWSEQIGIVSRGSSWICTGLDAEIVAPSAIGPRRCPVQTLRKLTPEEVAALPPKAKP
jgi:hypothetical protein